MHYVIFKFICLIVINVFILLLKHCELNYSTGIPCIFISVTTTHARESDSHYNLLGRSDATTTPVRIEITTISETQVHKHRLTYTYFKHLHILIQWNPHMHKQKTHKCVSAFFVSWRISVCNSELVLGFEENFCSNCIRHALIVSKHGLYLYLYSFTI